MGLTAIDHIIIGVNDLTQATADFSQHVGLLASGGGIHPSGGTANRIIVIGDTYLELIALDRPAEAHPDMLKRLAKGDGYINFVLASDDIAADSQAMVARGVVLVGPQAGALRSADGRTRGWSRVDIERSAMVQRYPFIIQHDSTGEERRYRLAGWHTPPEHPLGASGVHSTTIAVHDLAEATASFERIYGLAATKTSVGSDNAGQPASLVSFELKASAQQFELIAPPAQQATKSHLSNYLQQIGEGLYRTTLRVKDLAASRRFLDRQGISYSNGDGHASIWLHTEQTCGAAIVLRA